MSAAALVGYAEYTRQLQEYPVALDELWDTSLKRKISLPPFDQKEWLTHAQTERYIIIMLNMALFLGCSAAMTAVFQRLHATFVWDPKDVLVGRVMKAVEEEKARKEAAGVPG